MIPSGFKVSLITCMAWSSPLKPSPKLKKIFIYFSKYCCFGYLRKVNLYILN